MITEQIMTKGLPKRVGEVGFSILTPNFIAEKNCYMVTLQTMNWWYFSRKFPSKKNIVKFFMCNSGFLISNDTENSKDEMFLLLFLI